MSINVLFFLYTETSITKIVLQNKIFLHMFFTNIFEFKGRKISTDFIFNMIKNKISKNKKKLFKPYLLKENNNYN